MDQNYIITNKDRKMETRTSVIIRLYPFMADSYGVDPHPSLIN